MRSLFGVSEIYKDKKSVTEKEQLEKMKEGDRAYDLLEQKFINGEEVTVEEFRAAESSLKEAVSIINAQFNEHISIFSDKLGELRGAPTELINMLASSFAAHAVTIMSSICYKKALLKLIRKKYKIEKSYDLDTEDIEDTRKKESEKGE